MEDTIVLTAKKSYEKHKIFGFFLVGLERPFSVDFEGFTLEFNFDKKTVYRFDGSFRKAVATLYARRASLMPFEGQVVGDDFEISCFKIKHMFYCGLDIHVSRSGAPPFIVAARPLEIHFGFDGGMVDIDYHSDSIRIECVRVCEEMMAVVGLILFHYYINLAKIDARYNRNCTNEPTDQPIAVGMSIMLSALCYVWKMAHEAASRLQPLRIILPEANSPTSDSTFQ